MKTSFYNFSLEQLQDWLVTKGMKPFAAKQLFNWVYKCHITDFKQMSNIAKANQAMLDDLLICDHLEIVKVLTDENKETIIDAVIDGKRKNAIININE